MLEDMLPVKVHGDVVMPNIEIETAATSKISI